MSIRPASLPLPVLPANTSLRIATRLDGLLRTNLVAVGPSPNLVGRPAYFLVASGLDTGPSRDWSRREFPYTVAGEDAARRAFTAFGDAAATVQA